MSDPLTDRLWTVDDLAAYLGRKRSTVLTKLSRQPHAMPPPVRGLKGRWEPGVVRAWAAEQSTPVRKLGRPRLVR